MRKINGALIVVLGVIMVFGVFSLLHKDKWSLFYYPDGCLSCANAWKLQIDAFDSKESCLIAGNAMRKERIASDSYSKEDTFECGSNCKKQFENLPDSTYKCDETAD